MKAQSFQVRSLKNQIAACLRLIESKVKSVILRLLDLEEKLEVALSEQMQYSEAQIKEAFQKVAGDFRYWKAEMIEIIPTLVGLGLRNCDPWEYWAKFEPIQKAEALGWNDRAIALAIDTANLLGA